MTLIPQNKAKTVQVNSNMKIWQLIIQSGKAFGMRSSEFRIVTSSGPIEISIYNDPISQYQIKNIQIKRCDEKVLDKENPRRLIAQNTQLIKQLINSTSISAKNAQQI